MQLQQSWNTTLQSRISENTNILIWLKVCQYHPRRFPFLKYANAGLQGHILIMGVPRYMLDLL